MHAHSAHSITTVLFLHVPAEVTSQRKQFDGSREKLKAKESSIFTHGTTEKIFTCLHAAETHIDSLISHWIPVVSDTEPHNGEIRPHSEVICKNLLQLKYC